MGHIGAAPRLAIQGAHELRHSRALYAKDARSVTGVAALQALRAQFWKVATVGRSTARRLRSWMILRLCVTAGNHISWHVGCCCYSNMRPHRIPRIGSLIVSAILAGGLVTSCASKGTEPHAMTASEHEAAASAEEQSETKRAGEFDSKATDRRGPSPTTYPGCTTYASSNCHVSWGFTQNPTERHKEEAARHRRVADQHRAASQALRDAEQRFCTGIPARGP